MNDKEIQEHVRDALGAAHQEQAPPFDAVWLAAEQRHRRSRRRYAAVGGIAASVAVLAVVAGLWPSQETALTDEYLIADSLLNGTQWSAPSDALLPQHQIDIYQDMPVLLESTELNEGSLL